MKKTILLIALMALSGCSTSGIIQSQMANSGRPQHIIDAAAHGCESGEAAAGNMFQSFKKDYSQYNSNKEYAQRWEDAFRQCKGEYENAWYNTNRR